MIVGHVCIVYGLQRELKIQKSLHKKSFKLWGQSGVVNVFGLKTLDHLFAISLVFIFLSLFPWILTLGLVHGLSIQRFHTQVNTQKQLKQATHY